MKKPERITLSIKIKHIEEKAKKSMPVLSEISWGGNETSMIDRKALPYVQQMFGRLIAKYSEVLKKRGGTIVVLREIRNKVKKLMDEYENKDADKYWQYKVIWEAFEIAFYMHEYVVQHPS